MSEAPAGYEYESDIQEWGGRRYRREPDGRWLPVYDHGEPEPDVLEPVYWLRGKPHRLVAPGIYEALPDPDKPAVMPITAVTPGDRFTGPHSLHQRAISSVQQTKRNRELNPELNRARLQLDDDLISALCYHAENGATMADAAALVGQHVQNLRIWQAQGAKDAEAEQDTVYARFNIAWTHARARFKQALVDSAVSAAMGDGRLALEILSRMYPEEFGKRDKLDLNVQLDQLIKAAAAEDGTDEAALRAEVERLRALPVPKESHE